MTQDPNQLNLAPEGTAAETADLAAQLQAAYATLTRDENALNAATHEFNRVGHVQALTTHPFFAAQEDNSAALTAELSACQQEKANSEAKLARYRVDQALLTREASRQALSEAVKAHAQAEDEPAKVGNVIADHELQPIHTNHEAQLATLTQAIKHCEDTVQKERARLSELQDTAAEIQRLTATTLEEVARNNLALQGKTRSLDELQAMQMLWETKVAIEQVQLQTKLDQAFTAAQERLNAEAALLLKEKTAIKARVEAAIASEERCLLEQESYEEARQREQQLFEQAQARAHQTQREQLLKLSQTLEVALLKDPTQAESKDEIASLQQAMQATQQALRELTHHAQVWHEKRVQEEMHYAAKMTLEMQQVQTEKETAFSALQMLAARLTEDETAQALRLEQAIKAIQTQAQSEYDEAWVLLQAQRVADQAKQQAIEASHLSDEKQLVQLRKEQAHLDEKQQLIAQMMAEQTLAMNLAEDHYQKAITQKQQAAEAFFQEKQPAVATPTKPSEPLCTQRELLQQLLQAQAVQQAERIAQQQNFVDKQIQNEQLRLLELDKRLQDLLQQQAAIQVLQSQTYLTMKAQLEASIQAKKAQIVQLQASKQDNREVPTPVANVVVGIQPIGNQTLSEDARAFNALIGEMARRKRAMQASALQKKHANDVFTGGAVSVPPLIAETPLEVTNQEMATDQNSAVATDPLESTVASSVGVHVVPEITQTPTAVWETATTVQSTTANLTEAPIQSAPLFTQDNNAWSEEAISQTADVSDASGVADVSDVSSVADVPDVSSVADVPDVSSVPDVSDVADLADVSNTAKAASPQASEPSEHLSESMLWLKDDFDHQAAEKGELSLDPARQLDEAPLPKKGAKPSYEDLDFIPGSKKALLNESAPGMYWLLYSIILFFVIALVWANYALVDQTIVAEGKVIPTTQVFDLQSLDGGVLAALYVKEGQKVSKGQVLVRIDNKRFGSSYQEAQKRKWALMAEVIRLNAESTGLMALEFPQEVQLGASEAVTQQTQLFQTRQAQLKATTATLQHSYDLANQELKITQPLVKEGLMSQLDLLRLQREINQLKGELQNKIDQFRTDAQQQLSTKQAELVPLLESVKGLQDRSDRTTLSSPMEGTVKKIDLYPGEVVEAAKNILEIVPLEDKLLIEAKVKPADIGFVHVNDPAMVKVSAYDYSIYGGLSGQVVYVSADSIQNEKNPDETYYIIRVRTDVSYLQKNDQRYSIIPGMTVTVDVKGAKKSVLTYLSKPFLKAKEEALREH